MNEGRHKATIVSNDIRSAGTGSEFVHILLDIDGEKIAAQVWLTRKAINMAKGQLRACGFDYANEALTILKENNQHLAGRTVDVEVTDEEYQGRSNLKARIIAAEVTKKRITEIEKQLRGRDEKEDSLDAVKPDEGSDEFGEIPF